MRYARYAAAVLVMLAAVPAMAQVRTTSGVVQGTTTEDAAVRVFKGIPFAAPPVGDLRWKAPQPVPAWTGVRKTAEFGPRCMQRPIFGDMNFRSNGMSEDCLYLNVWTPAKTGSERLPVLVYFFGGGFMAGDGSEPRYDGESMARKGIVALTVNYRLTVFGFMAHPELTKESPHGASGNYALLDQHAALRWVQQNIAAFGGDPKRVTIAGESAGSVAVSAQMASPLSKGLIAGAIGESGSVMGTLSAVPLAQAEQEGVKFAGMVGAKSLAELRAMPAERLLEATAKSGRFSLTVDGHFFPKPPVDVFAAGEQAKVPLLLGWNSEEMNYRALLREDPTAENFAAVVRKLYGERADEVLKLYGSSTADETVQAATDLAGDRFIAYSTWKWFDLHSRTGNSPVYLYLYARPRPAMKPEMGDAVAGMAGGVLRGKEAQANRPPPPRGAVHSAEIEYAMGNLATNKVYDWTPDDYKVSEVLQGFFANFVKTGNPNGAGLPKWPAARAADPKIVRMRVDVASQAEPVSVDRYLLLDRIESKRPD